MRGTKRTGEDFDDQDRHRDISQLSDHLGSVNRSGHYAKGELEWKDIGSGVFARRFPKAERFRTTSSNRFRVADIYGRIIRSLSTEEIIDHCIVDAVPKEIRNRYLNHPDDLQVELIMKGAMQMINRRRADVPEVYSEPRIT